MLQLELVLTVDTSQLPLWHQSPGHRSSTLHPRPDLELGTKHLQTPARSFGGRELYSDPRLLAEWYGGAAAELIVSDSATSTPISTDLLRGNVEKRGSGEDDWCLSKIVILRQLSGLGDTTQSKCRFICIVIVSEGTLRGSIYIIFHMFPRIYPNPQTHIHLIWLICYL